jgi:hypothetical protein
MTRKELSGYFAIVMLVIVIVVIILGFIDYQNLALQIGVGILALFWLFGIFAFRDDTTMSQKDETGVSKEIIEKPKHGLVKLGDDGELVDVQEPDTEDYLIIQ